MLCNSVNNFLLSPVVRLPTAKWHNTCQRGFALRVYSIYDQLQRRGVHSCPAEGNAAQLHCEFCIKQGKLSLSAHTDMPHSFPLAEPWPGICLCSVLRAAKKFISHVGLNSNALLVFQELTGRAAARTLKPKSLASGLSN